MRGCEWRIKHYNLVMTDPEIEYRSALDYLYSFVDYSLKHSSELARADFNLDRMFALAEALGNPQRTYPIIHVAGTKGKGSVSALCAYGLQAAGYTVGCYTSPHLIDFCERIQVNGEPIGHAELARLVEKIKPAVARIPKLTTFELTTAGVGHHLHLIRSHSRARRYAGADRGREGRNYQAGHPGDHRTATPGSPRGPAARSH
jgi:hypothetical protein